jgi:hypothetical protein
VSRRDLKKKIEEIRAASQVGDAARREAERKARVVAELEFLGWCAQKLQQRSKKALLLIWDSASWHKSHQVRGWIAAHNYEVKASGRGVRIVPCLLPTKSPWLNAIEPKWIHGKRKIVEPERLLGAYELADRVCGAFGCIHEPHLSIPQEVV